MEEAQRRERNAEEEKRKLLEESDNPASQQFAAEITDLLRGSFPQEEDLLLEQETFGGDVSKAEREEDDIVEDYDNSSSSDSAEVYTVSIWSILKKSAINLVLPFINGLMLGFGEILAHEIGFRYNWIGAKVQPPRRIENKKRRSAFL
ncbi:Piso0_002402 [Millerozyma farinosa CBS 7064]|uniref:Piso0_002402 protein n=1 Tax=Pichia sorbitophila (strain ATCC MYA-4447 / BCRC 22081 / CBS 7064 / NBRC 10061 / NRRL Y-12695) TaxID=559304 RepID=G8YCI5_PICSO|nr:Piso0_002402 [Millerozyma farinosa CBS 7064]